MSEEMNRIFFFFFFPQPSCEPSVKQRALWTRDTLEQPVHGGAVQQCPSSGPLPAGDLSSELSPAGFPT